MALGNSNRPVVTAASISSVLATIALVASYLGFVAPAAELSGQADAIGAAVIALVTVGSHLLAAFKSEKQVTPVAAPRDNNGVALVPATPWGE